MKKPSKPPTTIIDPQKMPFSEAELYAAFRLLLPIRVAKDVSRLVADGVRGERWSETSAAAAIARGSTDPMEINSATFVYPAVLFYLLALRSPQMHERVRQWHAAIRAHSHRRLLAHATFELTRKRPVEPWPEEAVRKVQTQYDEEDANWDEGLALVASELEEMRARDKWSLTEFARIKGLLAPIMG